MSSVLIAVTIMPSATTILSCSFVLVLMVSKTMATSIKMPMSAPHLDIIFIEMPVASISMVDMTVNVMTALLIMNSLVFNANVCYTNIDCTDSIGPYQCLCAGGYNETADGKCVDIDELMDCTVNHEKPSCMNTEGTYYCYRETDFIENGVSCEDIDECLAIHLGN